MAVGTALCIPRLGGSWGGSHVPIARPGGALGLAGNPVLVITLQEMLSSLKTTDDLVSFRASSLVALAESGIENERGGCWGPSYGRATGSGVLALC